MCVCMYVCSTKIKLATNVRTHMTIIKLATNVFIIFSCINTNMYVVLAKIFVTLAVYSW